MRSSVTYTATLEINRSTAEFLAGKLAAHRRALGTRKGTRALGAFKQAVLVLRWFVEDARIRQLAADNGIGKSTASFEIARAAEDYPTPEVISSLRTARRITRHAGVPKELDREFKRMEPALANRLEVAFRLPDGRVRQVVGDHTAVITTDGGVELSWWQGDKKLKSIPAAAKRDHPEEAKRLRELAKRTAQQQATLARALEAGYTSEPPPPYRRLEGHAITDRLIWEFEVAPGVWRAELGLSVPDVPVRLWHPARASVEEVRAWREVVEGRELRQPYKQAFREVYLLTPAEETSGTSSNRFAGHVVDYRKLRALVKDRSWKSNYLGFWDGGHEDGAAQRVLAGGQWRATRPPLRSPGRPPVNRREERQRFWRLIAEGLSSEEAAH